MVLNTSDDLPDPETPVNTVNRRLGISTLTSFRLFSRAPWMRIRSWLSAGCLEEAMFAIMSLSLARRERTVHDVLARFCHIEEVSSVSTMTDRDGGM